MTTRKRKNTKSEQNTKAKPVKLVKGKSAVVSNGVPLWQKLLGFLIICAAAVAAAVVLGVISIDDIKAIKNPFGASKRELVEEPVLGDDASPASGSFRSDEAESNKSKLKEKEKITPEVVTEEDDQPQSINEEQNLRGDLAGSDVQETIKTEEAKSVKEEPAEKKKAKEDSTDPLMNASDLKLAKEIQRADKLLQQKKTEQALRKFESLLKQHPESPRLRYGRAQALDQMAEEKRSNEILKSSIDAYGEVAQGSDCPDELKKLALRRQAERMSFMGQTRSSVTVLNGLMKDFPSDIQIKKELGVQYLIMGADAKAKPFFEQVLKLDPDDGFAKVHLGFILKREGLFEEAIVHLREGIESNQEGTSDGKYFFHLGDAYHRTGRPEEANSIYALGADKGLFRSAMQRSLYNVDTLHGQPWWTPKKAKFEAAVQQLESKWQVIRKEGLALMDKETQLFQSEDESLRDTGDWKQFMLYMRGKKDTKNCARAPETCKIIDSIPQSAGCKRGQVKFSVMHPGTHVWPHTGPTNCRLRSHLGLVIPEGTRIRVVNETRTWEEGKVLIFDDSFEHEVWQEADSFRLVLIVDLWHPDLTEQQKRYLSPI